MNWSNYLRLFTNMTSPLTIQQYKLPYLVVIGILAVLYWVAGNLGLQFAVLHDNVSLIWGAAGIAFAVLATRGVRFWPGITLGAFLVNWGTGLNFPSLVLIAAGNTAAVCIGVLLFRHFAYTRTTFEHTSDVLFFMLAIVTAALVSASVGMLALSLGQPAFTTRPALLWLEWLMGDVIGFLIFAPLLLLWLNNGKIHHSRSRWLEIGILLVALLLTSQFVFTYNDSFITDYPLTYLFFPFIVWSALRFGKRTNATLCLIIAIISAVGTFRELPLLLPSVVHRNLISLWSFIAVITIVDMLLSTVIAERQRIGNELEQQRDQITQIMNGIAHGVAVTDMDGRFEFVNPSYAQMLGQDAQSLIGKATKEVVPTEALAIVTNSALHMSSDFRTVYETRFHRLDGSALDVLINGSLRRNQSQVTGIITTVTDLTVQKRTEAALRRSETLLRAIINNIPFDLWVHDAQGHCILQTPESVRLWGNVQGKSVEQVNVPETVKQQWQAMNERVLQGETIYGDVVYEKAGEPRNYYYISSPIRDADSSLLGIMGINIDITDRLNAQTALRQSEDKARDFLEQLKALQDLTIELAQIDDFDEFCKHAIVQGRDRLKFERLGLWLVDTDNPAYTVGTYGTHENGALRDERNVRAPSSLILPDLTNLLQINNQKIFYNPDTQILNENSQSVGRGWKALGLLNDGKQIIGGLATDNYFTGEPAQPYQLELLALYANVLGQLCVLNRAKASLQASEARFRSIFDGAKVGIALANAGGLITSVNPAFAELTGYSQTECEGKLITEFSHHEEHENTLELFRRLLNQEIDYYQMEKRYVRKQGDLVWVRLNVSPFPDYAEPQIIAIVENIDARKHAEHELQLLTLSLEQRVAERTAELQDANVRLTELDRLKSKFIADVTHELRTPLTILSTRVYLLQHSPVEKHAIHLAALKEQLERLTNFVNATLDLSRLDLAQDHIAFGPVDLNDVVGQVVSALLPRAEIAGLQIVFDAGDIPPVKGEYNQLAQVVTNLVANAINYTPDGGVNISTSFDEDHAEICLAIVDTGMGISEAEIPHLFTRFYRGEKAGQSNIPGTGLGLSIVQEIVNLHKGRIVVESQVGHGTIFKTFFPQNNS